MVDSCVTATGANPPSSLSPLLHSPTAAGHTRHERPAQWIWQRVANALMLPCLDADRRWKRQPRWPKRWTCAFACGGFTLFGCDSKRSLFRHCTFASVASAGGTIRSAYSDSSAQLDHFHLPHTFSATFGLQMWKKYLCKLMMYLLLVSHILS